MMSYAYEFLPRNSKVSLTYPRREESHRQETVLVVSAEKQTHNYDIECSNHHPLQSP